MTTDRLDDLISTHLAGALEPAQRTELAALLAADPAAHRRFADLVAIDRRLRALHAPEAPIPAGAVLAELAAQPADRLPPHRPRPARAWWPWIAVPGAIAATLAALVLVPARPEPTTRSFGALTADGAPLPPGSAVLPGMRLAATADAGWTQLDGTRIALAAGTRARLDPPAPGTMIALEAGELSAVVSPQPPGAPLRVTTPDASLEVLGTRFRVAVAPGSTGLSVEEGRVALTGTDDGERIEVAAGGHARTARGRLAAASPRSGASRHDGPLPRPTDPAAASAAGEWTSLTWAKPIALSLLDDGHVRATFVWEGSGFGQIAHPIAIPDDATAVALPLRVETCDPAAVWSLVLRQRDHTCWELLTGSCRDLTDGTVRATLDRPLMRLFGQADTLDRSAVVDVLLAIDRGDATLVMGRPAAVR